MLFLPKFKKKEFLIDKYYRIKKGLMNVEDSRKYSFCRSFRKKYSYKIAMIIVSYQ